MEALDAPVRIPWGCIENRAERVLILGAGPSLSRTLISELRQVSEAGVHIIAVNASILAAPFANDWFSLDFDERTRALAKEASAQTRIIAAVPDDFGMPDARVASHRCEVPGGVLYLHRIEGTGPLRAKFGLCEATDGIHTGNSVWGALGVAWHMKPRRIAFLGLDGSQLPGWPGKHTPRCLNHLRPLFATAVRQLIESNISVRVGNQESRITCFPRVSPKSALRWLCS